LMAAFTARCRPTLWQAAPHPELLHSGVVGAMFQTVFKR
jgi:hypothetical protein